MLDKEGGGAHAHNKVGHVEHVHKPKRFLFIVDNGHRGDLRIDQQLKHGAKGEIIQRKHFIALRKSDKEDSMHRNRILLTLERRNKGTN